ncbi:hypothetical protein [Hyphococcus luteus]|uniref:Lipoprotein n=1 Tax=Hyphococcus luteus TaxID=2058213 RepID=A0A2S7K3X3_9PROT|nr:hypothetical protein [Marinicaulis flavus]PQA87199.1 hypothetical protein CW354_14260 [Marinicaulis flavus]
MIVRLMILPLVAVLSTGCATGRAISAKSFDDVGGINACVGGTALTRMIGGVDRTIAIPGGGFIEIHDVLVKPQGAGIGVALTSLATLGAWDLAESAASAGSDCDKRSKRSGSGGMFKCDFKKLRFFLHYADASADQMACWEMKEVWVGDSFNTMGDDSKCPIEYKNALSQIIDTADFPTAIHSWTTGAPADAQRAFQAQADVLSVYELLKLMTADNRANCPK